MCALLLLSTAQRVQTIHLIKLSSVKIDDKRATLLNVYKVKSTRLSFHQKALELNRFDEKRLCVIESLKLYIEKTEKLRRDNNNLILCYSKPYGAVSEDPLARWMKELLNESGILGFNAHSFRSASSSYMFKRGVPLDSILQMAGWSNARTFYKFYL